VASDIPECGILLGYGSFIMPLFLEYFEGCKAKGKIALLLISHRVVKNYWELW